MSSERTFTSYARDPRLNRPPPIGANSLDTPSRKAFTSPSASRQYEPRADVSGDQFVQRLSDLIQAAVKTASLTSEKEAIQKKQSTTEGLLKRAKAQSSFPSTTAFFQQTWNDEGGHMARIDGALKEHLSRFDQLEKALKANWTSSLIPGPSLVEKYDQLKEEIETTKQDAKRSKDEASSLRDQNRSLEDTLRSLQARMTMLEKSLENHGTSLDKQTKDYSSRLEEISLEFEKRWGSTSTKVEESIFKVEESIATKLQAEADEWQKQRTALGTELKSLRTCQESFSAAIDKVDQTTKEQQQKISGIEPLGQRLDILDTRLSSVESTRTAPPASMATNEPNVDKVSTSYLQSKVESLENILNQLQSLQEMKDDLHFSEVEDLKKSLVQASEELVGVKNNCNMLSDEVKTLRESNPAAALQRIANLSGSLQNTQQVVETVRVGLHSLETRYNSLTTEPLARNMVAALQEMYPSASQLLEQYSGLKTAVDNLCQSQNTFVRQTQQEAALRLDELNKLKNDHASLSQSLAPLWERYGQQNRQGQPPSQNDIRKLEVDLHTLCSKFEASTSTYDSQFRSREQSDDHFRERLRDERSEFDSRLSQVASSLERLANDVEVVRSVNTSSLAKVDMHASDIRSLQDDLHQLKEATSDRHQAFLDQLSEITKVHSAHDTNLSSLLDQISEVERSEKLRHKELHEQLDELKKAVEAKEFHPRAVSPIIVEDQAPNPTDDSPADTEEAARILSVAETNPTLALREKKKKKKKRPRPSGLSEDEKTPIIARQESPRSLSSGASPLEQGEPTENRRPKKKKKRKMVSTEPIPLD